MVKHFKLTVALFILCTLFIIGGCDKKGDYLLDYATIEYVDLFDYKNLHISEDYIQVSNSEIEMVIEADLDSKGIYREITNRDTVEIGDIILCDIASDTTEYRLIDYYFFTDDKEFEDIADKIIGMKKGEYLYFTSDVFESTEDTYKLQIKNIYTFAQANDESLVLSMYDCDSMDEVYEYVKNKTENTVIFNYALEKILYSSKIKKIPKQADKYVEKNIDKIIEEKSFNQIDNLEEYLGMTLEEYKEYCYNIYFEYMIYVAITEKENLVYSQNDFDNAIKLIADKNNISVEDVVEIYDKEYIIYEMIIDEVEKEILSSVIVV